MLQQTQQQPAHIAHIVNELIAFNAASNSLAAAIDKSSRARILHRAFKIKVANAFASGFLDKALFDAFEAKVEEQAEQALSAVATISTESIIKGDKNDPFSSIESDATVSSEAIIIDKDEFLAEQAKIYSDETVGTINELPRDEIEAAPKVKIESFSLSITLNERQLAAKEMALAGKSFVLIGAAGTGKTTTQRSVASTLLDDSRLKTSKFKTYTANGKRLYITAPSIAFVAYTRRAATNLCKAIHKDPEMESALRDNIMTIHSLLEYEPETYFDPNENKDKFRFAPRRNATNPLDITHLIIEEASMVGAHDLWMRLYEALPPGVQIIFIGDINQLTPVFGPSILNYALINLPIIELIEGYRNQGIVLENAHNILAGRSIVENENYKVVEPLGKDKKGNKVQIGQEKISYMLRNFFETLSTKVDADGELEYDPEDCMILSPWNKQALGTDNLNKHIAQFLGDKRGAIVHEVLAGMNKVYIALGDKVMFNKRDGIITAIERNAAYFGKEPQIPGSDLLRFGTRRLANQKDSIDDLVLDYSNFSIEALEDEKAERKQQATHCVTVTYEDGSWDTLSATGDFGPVVFSLGYVLTVHKAQGSEWRKVFIVLYKDFAVSLYRELLYTAATRARTKVTLIATRAVIEKAIKSQRIKGNNLQDKLEYFNTGADLSDNVPIIPPTVSYYHGEE